jgi:signal transduction histidine kinase/DNA-binding NarL/FixJ family response regulator
MPWRTRLGARLLLVFVGVALTPMLAGMLLSYQRARTSLIDLALSKVQQEAALTAKDLGTSLEQFSSDLLMLSSAPPVQGLLLAQGHGGQDPATGRSYEEWIDWLRQLFATTARGKQFYQQLRFIDQNGQETVRIEYRDGTVLVAWAGRGGELESYRVALENRASAGYFTAAKRLPRGQIAISALTLSQEESADTPAVPMIYFSTPVYDQPGSFRGVVVSTVYASVFLQRLQVTEGHIYLTDQDGYYLVHPDPKHTFGLARGTGYRVTADFPQPYATVLNSGQDAYTTLDAGRGEVVALQKLHFDPLRPRQYWLLIRTLPEEAVLGPVRSLSALVLEVALVVVVLVALLALRLAASFTRPIVQLTGVAKQISQTDLPRLVDSLGQVATGDVTTRFELSARPVVVRSADEVGQLERAFNEMTASLREAHIRLVQTQEQLRIQKEAAEVANRAKSVFLANMSHDLRTPLNAIINFTKFLSKERYGELSPRQQELQSRVLANADHLLTLINDILDLAKVEAGRLELNPTAVDLPTFLDSIVGIIRACAEAEHLTLIFEAPTPLSLWVQADETRLRQILLNLLSNAVKFTDVGRVTFRVSVCSESSAASSGSEQTDAQSSEHVGSCVLRFEVTDSGPGIAPGQLERIFQPFEQVGDLAHRIEGTGLGLAISRQLVQLMGGDLHVESEEDRGSTFWFSLALPLVKAAVGARVSQERVIAGYSGRRRRVLVVDDIPSNRAVLVSLLKPLGFDLREAADGQEAIAAALTALPDLILMDQHMPGLSGLEAAQQIRRTPALHGVRLISVSASVSEADQALGREAGYDAFLPKPISWPRLVELLAKHLELEWEYTEGGETAATAEQALGPLVPPSSEELAVLYDLARRGDLRGIRERVLRLERQDDVLRPFARRLHLLAERFEGRAILALVEHYREHAHECDLGHS